MDGPGWATYIIPAVVIPVLAFWLIMVYYAAAHPVHKVTRPGGRAAGGGRRVRGQVHDLARGPSRTGPRTGAGR